jgi:hypothetical protein
MQYVHRSEDLEPPPRNSDMLTTPMNGFSQQERDMDVQNSVENLNSVYTACEFTQTGLIPPQQLTSNNNV